jgi:hypothetical protein
VRDVRTQRQSQTVAQLDLDVRCTGPATQPPGARGAQPPTNATARDQWIAADRRSVPLETPGMAPPVFSPSFDSLHDWTATVTHCGRVCFKNRKVNLSQVFAGQNVGVKQVSDRVWLVTFMQYDLGYFDDETCRLEPIENPFGPKVLPMSPE